MIDMWGHECVTSPGQVRLASNDALAGSAITLLRRVPKPLRGLRAPRPRFEPCCLNPRDALRLPGPPRTYLQLDGDLEIIGKKTVEDAV